MNKNEFLGELERLLDKLPAAEVRQSIDFYAEVIDDRMEDGATEQEAVAALGSVETIANQIVGEMPAVPKAVARIKTSNRFANIVLAVVLSPIWVPLSAAFILTVAAIYVAIWAVIASLWLCIVILLAMGPIGIVGFIWNLTTGFPLTGVFILGTGLTSCGLGLFAILGMRSVSSGLVHLTRLFARSVKSLFVREKAEGSDDQIAYGALSGADKHPAFQSVYEEGDGHENRA